MKELIPASPPGARVSFETIFREKQLWILIAVTLVYFYQPLFFETFFFRDLFTFHLPQKKLFAEIVKNGELPLWDPYLHGGQPFLGRINNGALYPFNLLYLIFPLLTAFNLDLVLHVVMCAAAAYLLARVLGLNPVPSLISASIYAYCGHTLSHINLGARLQVLPYFPLLVLFWHLYLLELRRKWFALAVIAGVLTFFAGAVEVTLIYFPFLLGWSFFYAYQGKSNLNKLAAWFVLVIFVAGIAAVQILPGREVASISSRSQAVPYAQFSAWSLNPRRLPEIILPGFIGFKHALSQRDYWGKLIEDPPFPFVISIYFGCLTLALAFAGSREQEGTNWLLLRTRRFLLGVCLIAILLSLGRFLPFFRFFYESVPVISSFRIPIKLWNAVVLPIALLAGFGAQAHFSDHRMNRTASSKRIALYWFVFVFLAVMTTAFLTFMPFSDHFQNLFFRQSGEEARMGLSRSLIHACAIWLAGTLVYQHRRIRPNSTQQWLIALIVMFDLLVAGLLANVYAPRELLSEPELSQIVRSNIENGRMFQIARKNIRLRAPSNDIVWGYHWDLQTLNHNLGAFFGIPLIFDEDIDGLTRKDMVELKRQVDSRAWPQRLPLLNTGAASLVLTTEDVSLPELERIATIRNPTDLPLHLYRNKTARSTNWVAFNYVFVATKEEALKMVLAPDFDPHQRPVLQHSGLADSNPGCRSEISQPKTSFGRSSFSVSSNCKGYLIFSEPFDPNWRVSVDGRSVLAVPANYAFTAILLEPGTHRVERKYFPNSVLSGSILSSITIAVLIVLFWKGRSTIVPPAG